MEQPSKNSPVLIVIIAILAIIVVVAIVLAAYFWGKSKSGGQTTPTSSPAATKSAAVSSPTPTANTKSQVSPTKVVENFMNYTIGTLPTASLNFNAARALMTDDLKAQFSDDSSFAAQFYGYQDGPTSVELVTENINGSDASVKVNASWGEMGLGWAFSLTNINNQWLLSDFRNDAQ